jgi:hypothetical protein
LVAPTPGGVLLSPAAAGKLGDGLTIDEVEYVPGSREVKVTGRNSVMGLDADLLAMTLRLAFAYQHVPYFSLNPHESHGENWVAARKFIGEEVSERLQQDSAFAERVRENAFKIADHTGQPHLVSYLDQIDPALAASVSRRMPMNMDLVFEPKWLKRTRLGEILFISDQSLKELWRGAAVWTRGPSRALTVGTHIAPKFWGERDTVSRWWFTPGGQVGEAGNVLDLSHVQPVLQTERVADVTHDPLFDPLSSVADQDDPWTRAVLGEVNRHFESYSQALPEWEGLRQVFRAYVFAIWLAKHDPDMGTSPPVTTTAIAPAFQSAAGPLARPANPHHAPGT